MGERRHPPVTSLPSAPRSDAGKQINNLFVFLFYNFADSTRNISADFLAKLIVAT